MCGSRPCYKNVGPKGYLYKDVSASADGIQLLKLLEGNEGKSFVLLKGKNNPSKGQTSLPTGIAAALSGSTSTTLQLSLSDGFEAGLSTCYSVTLDTVRKDTGDFFRALKK